MSLPSSPTLSPTSHHHSQDTVHVPVSGLLSSMLPLNCFDPFYLVNFFPSFSLGLNITSSRKPSLTFHFVRSPFCYPRPSLTMQGVLFGCCGCVRSSFSGVPAPGAEPSTRQGWWSWAGGAHGLWAALVGRGHLEKDPGLWAPEKNRGKEQSSGVWGRRVGQSGRGQWATDAEHPSVPTLGRSRLTAVHTGLHQTRTADNDPGPGGAT